MTVLDYLRFPHLNGDLLTFVAEDDVWIAPLSGGNLDCPIWTGGRLFPVRP